MEVLRIYFGLAICMCISICTKITAIIKIQLFHKINNELQSNIDLSRLRDVAEKYFGITNSKLSYIRGAI